MTARSSQRPREQEQNTVATLERRLSDGWDRIEYARSQGQDTEAWQDFWIELLHQYEAACDELDPVGEEPDF